MGVRIYDPAYSPDQPIAVVRPGTLGWIIADKADEIGGYDISVGRVRKILKRYEEKHSAKGQSELIQGEVESIRKWIEGRPDEDSLMFFVT